MHVIEPFACHAGAVMLNLFQHLETLKQVQGDRTQREQDPETSLG